MIIIDHFRSCNGELCPICGTSEDKQSTLVTIDGTKIDNRSQAIQVHVDCLDLIFIRVQNGTAAIGMGFINKEKSK